MNIGSYIILLIVSYGDLCFFFLECIIQFAVQFKLQSIMHYMI